MLSHYITELFHFSQGVSLPAIHVMLTKWALPQERNLISSLAYAGKNPIVFSNSSVINVDEWTNNRNGFGHCHLAPILRHFGWSSRLGIGLLRPRWSGHDLVRLVADFRLRLAAGSSSHPSGWTGTFRNFHARRWRRWTRTRRTFALRTILKISR